MSRSSMVRQVKCTFVLAQLALFLANPARAEPLEPAQALTGKPGGLTSEQVAKRATATSPDAEQKLHEAEAARTQLDQALYDFFPRLTLTGSYTRLSKVGGPELNNVVIAPNAAPGVIGAGETLVAAPLGFQTLQNSTSGTATLAIPLSDYVFRLCQAHAGAKAQLQGSELSLVAARRKADYDARALYYDWVRAELDAAVAQQNLDLSHENLLRMQALANADSAAEADVARVEATVASSELVLEQAKNVAALQRERVGIAMHAGSTRDFQIGEDLTKPPAERPDLNDIAELTRVALEQRPELKALSAQVRVYDKQADVARSLALPRLDATGQATVANPNQRYFPQRDQFNGTWQVGVQLSYSPNDTADGLSQRAAAKAKAAEASAKRRSFVDAVRTEVTEAALAHRNAQASLSTSARRLAAAETSYRARRERFLAEKATTVELTEAQTELFNAKLDAVKAQVSIRSARARLAYATGREQ